MKKLFTLSFFLISFSAIKAQKGSLLVGGDVSYSSAKSPGFILPDVKSHSINLNPYVGYQFTGNWTAGIVVGLNNAKQEQGANEQRTNSFNAGPFVRYTKTLSAIFSLYGQLEGRFGSTKFTSDGMDFPKTNNTTINFFPAAFINLKNNFGLNFNFGGISYARDKTYSGAAPNSFNINFGKVATIGISKNFGGKK